MYKKQSNRKPKVLKEQRGGASDWWNSFNAYHMSPAELSRYTLQYIDRAPMFNPLVGCGTIIPTGTSGIIPTGVYLANHPSAQVRSENYKVKAKPIRGTPPCGCSAPKEEVKMIMIEGEDEQMGGANLNPAPYPGCGSTMLPDYTGVTYGLNGCGSCAGVGDAASRYKVHYNATIGGETYGKEYNRDCQHVYNKLMGLDRQRLWALCRDNHVVIYHMDKETGRLTPNDKSAICHRLAKRIAAKGDESMLFLY